MMKRLNMIYELCTTSLSSCPKISISHASLISSRSLFSASLCASQTPCKISRGHAIVVASPPRKHKLNMTRCFFSSGARYINPSVSFTLLLHASVPFPSAMSASSGGLEDSKWNPTTPTPTPRAPHSLDIRKTRSRRGQTRFRSRRAAIA
jgi:hypothetical protein